MSDTTITRTHQGITFTVAPRTPCAGIGWAIPRWNQTSQGAFYDNVPEHPEGAYAWAEAACRAYIERMVGIIGAPAFRYAAMEANDIATGYGADQDA